MRPADTVGISLLVIVALLFAGGAVVMPFFHSANDARLEYENAKDFAWLSALGSGLSRANCDPQDKANERVDVDGLAGYPVWCRGADGQVAVKLTTIEGYNGDIELAVGFSGHGEVSAIVALTHEETPGFGADLLSWENDWLNQFANVSAEQQVNSIDAVSGATFTAKAVRDAVARIVRAELGTAHAPDDSDH